MPAGHDEKIPHAGDARSLDPDFAVVGTAENGRKERVVASAARNDAEVERNGRETRWQAVLRAEFEASGPGEPPVDPTKEWDARQDVCELASAVRRAEHDDPADLLARHISAIDGGAEQDTTRS